MSELMDQYKTWRETRSGKYDTIDINATRARHDFSRFAGIKGSLPDREMEKLEQEYDQRM